jgi:hypothetical protein
MLEMHADIEMFSRIRRKSSEEWEFAQPMRLNTQLF